MMKFYYINNGSSKESVLRNHLTALSEIYTNQIICINIWDLSLISLHILPERHSIYPIRYLKYLNISLRATFFKRFYFREIHLLIFSFTGEPLLLFVWTKHSKLIFVRGFITVLYFKKNYFCFLCFNKVFT